MNGVEFIEAELISKCYGHITVKYIPERGQLYVEITTDISFTFLRHITPDSMTDKAVLTAIVNIIKLAYIGFILDYYFKTSN